MGGDGLLRGRRCAAWWRSRSGCWGWWVVWAFGHTGNV